MDSSNISQLINAVDGALVDFSDSDISSNINDRSPAVMTGQQSTEPNTQPNTQPNPQSNPQSNPQPNVVDRPVTQLPSQLGGFSDSLADSLDSPDVPVRIPADPIDSVSSSDAGSFRPNTNTMPPRALAQRPGPAMQPRAQNQPGNQQPGNQQGSQRQMPQNKPNLPPQHPMQNSTQYPTQHPIQHPIQHPMQQRRRPPPNMNGRGNVDPRIVESMRNIAARQGPNQGPNHGPRTQEPRNANVPSGPPNNPTGDDQDQGGIIDPNHPNNAIVNPGEVDPANADANNNPDVPDHMTSLMGYSIPTSTLYFILILLLIAVSLYFLTAPAAPKEDERKKKKKDDDESEDEE